MEEPGLQLPPQASVDSETGPKGGAQAQAEGLLAQKVPDLNEQFLRAQRLESIGMLASGIAHDLNNVLAPIILAAPELREHATHPDDLRIITSLEKSAERGVALVRQIVAFAQGVGGGRQLVDVRHLLRDTISVIHETFPKNIRLEDYVPSDLAPVMADPTQIHQVILNLCVNARDAMPQGGTLKLRGENCSLGEKEAAEIEGARAGQWLVLHIEDTGTGIPDETLTRIWEPFFTTKAAGRGTGLGLSTVRGIVETHKGFVSLRTRVDSGTVFRVYLPASDQGSLRNHAAPSRRTATQGRGELVLVVDDEPHVREVTSAILSRHGYRVLLAGDGIEAVALFAARSSEIKLVVTDLRMPNLDGAALSHIVRRLNPAVRTLAVSGLSSGPDADELRNVAGAFLYKPFKVDALLQAVAGLLNPELA